MTQNKQMSENTKPLETTDQKQFKPDEAGSIVIDGFVRVFDPNTKETFVETRL